MKLKEVQEKLKVLFPEEELDFDPQTLIHGDGRKKIGKIAISLDLDTDTIKQAKKKGCDLLLIHHGLPSYDNPNHEIPKKKVDLLKKIDLAAYTLPISLDNSPYGTTAGLVKLLGIPSKPVSINFKEKVLNGAVYKSIKNVSHREIIRKVKAYGSATVRIVGKSKPTYQRCIFAAGGGFMTDILDQLKPDLYISGELEYKTIRMAKEMGTVLIELSHSSTEGPPLKYTAKYIEEQLSIKTVYIKHKEPKILNIRK